MTKRILMLGGADIQVSAICRAKELGLYVITCDYLPDNPGHSFADAYYNVSTTDREAVLELARGLKPDGILAYASDPAALTAAYVAEKLNLPGNPFHAVEILSRKDLFRQFMQAHGFLCPLAAAFTSYDLALAWFQKLNKDAIIKPVDASGSKGVFKLQKGVDLSELFTKSIAFSKTGCVLIEEFISKKGYQIGGDGFIINGELVFRCFGDIHFSDTNPLLPCSVSIPSLHEPQLLQKVHDEIQKLITLVGMKMGALNFDVLIDQQDQVYIIEIGPRNGGNMIPELTELCTGVDMKTASILAAIGEPPQGIKMGIEKGHYAHYVIHAKQTGQLIGITKSEELNNRIVYEHYNVKIGDQVSTFNSSANRLGIMLLQHQSHQQLLDLISNMPHHLKLQIQ